MSDKLYKVAIVGYGNAGKLHEQAIAKTSGLSLKIICDIDPCKNDRRYKFVEDYTKIDDVDLVSVATPHGSHYDIAKFFLDKGITTIVEKPISIDLKHAEILSSYRNCMPMLQNRLRPETQEAIEKVNKIKPFLVKINVLWHRPENYYSTWRGKREDGDCIVLNQAIHYFDVAQYILGERFSFDDEKFSYNVKHKLDYDDTYCGMGWFKSGAVQYCLSTACYETNYASNIEFIGKDGNYVLDFSKGKTNAYGGYTGSGNYQDLVFADAIKVIEGSRPKITSKDALDSLKLCFNIMYGEN